jgi:predicted nucleic acid-binding protein
VADVVVDASIAAKWQLEDEAHRENALLLLAQIESGRLRLLVPAIWDYEVASIFSKAAANARVEPAAARNTVEAVLDLSRIRVPLPSPLEAFDAARRFNRTLIDCFYLTIAEEYGCDFWTDDRKLVRTLGARYPFVRWIGDYPQPPTPTS